jgi:hypothetical protein
MLSDNALDARGSIICSFLIFSLWPASAMLTKVMTHRPEKNA